jgi:hypothetical protein
LAPAVVAEALVALEPVLVAVLPAALLPVEAPVVLLLKVLARLLREAQLLRPALPVVVAALPQEAEVAALLLVQGLVASASLGRR